MYVFSTMTAIVFDTETSGLPAARSHYSHTHHYDSARIVSIAWVVLGADYEVVDEEYHIVKPTNFTISHSAFRIHGISTDYATQHGKTIEQVLAHLSHTLNTKYPNASHLAAHNLDFDFNVLMSEIYRSNPQSQLLNRIQNMKKLCTMRATAHMFNGKWPRLEQLHAKCFPKFPFPNAHNALQDVKYCADCIHALHLLN